MSWLLLLWSAFALAAEPCAPTALHLVYPQQAPFVEPVQVQTHLDRTKAILSVHFNVTTPNAIFGPRVLKPKQYPFQFDVVEVFLSVLGGDHRPYYEIEVSPYNQTFYVLIDSHKLFHNHPQLVITTSAVIHGTGWSVDIQIPLGNLNWDGDPAKVYGNAFAILGRTRSYWSLSLPPTAQKPNFHQPQDFTPLACD